MLKLKLNLALLKICVHTLSAGIRFFNLAFSLLDSQMGILSPIMLFMLLISLELELPLRISSITPENQLKSVTINLDDSSK